MRTSRASSSRSALLVLLAFALFLRPSRAKADEVDVCVDAAEKSLTLRESHKLLEARTALIACADASCPAEIRETCDQRLAKLTPTIPSIVFAARDGSGRDLSAVKVTIDGAPAADRLAGTPFVLDPGDHEFTFEVAGEPPLVRHFVLLEGEQKRREEVIIGAPPPSVGPPPGPDALAERPHGKPMPMRRVLAVVSGGVGVAGIATGAISGELAISRVAASKLNCPFDGTMDRCSATGVSDMNQAKTFALASDISFGVGALGLVGGVMLWVMGAHRDPPTVPGPIAFSDPTSWFWGLTTTPHGSEGFLGHAF